MIVVLVKTGRASARIMPLDVSNKDCYAIGKTENILSVRPLSLRMISFNGLSILS